MKSYDCQPAELDIMLGFRLNQLHVLFLLRLALVKRVSDPDPDLVALAQTMLSLVIEALVFKDRLVHSGTSLSWKVSNEARINWTQADEFPRWSTMALLLQASSVFLFSSSSPLSNPLPTPTFKH